MKGAGLRRAADGRDLPPQAPWWRKIRPSLRVGTGSSPNGAGCSPPASAAGRPATLWLAFRQRMPQQPPFGMSLRVLAGRGHSLCRHPTRDFRRKSRVGCLPAWPRPFLSSRSAPFTEGSVKGAGLRRAADGRDLPPPGTLVEEDPPISVVGFGSSPNGAGCSPPASAAGRPATLWLAFRQRMPGACAIQMSLRVLTGRGHSLCRHPTRDFRRKSRVG